MAPADIFLAGTHAVALLQSEKNASSSSGPSPPKPLLIASPQEAGEYPLLLFLHGYLLYNSFYSQLIVRIASHGFIVIAPQLYEIAGADCTAEIKSAAATTDWLSSDGLTHLLPSHVRPNLCRLGVAGHSRGGKVGFALALGHATTRSKISALIGIDPVDGMDRGKQTKPPILTYVPRSFNLGMAVMVVGAGLGELRKNPLFPPCAPKGVNHQDFFNECSSPACYFVPKDYGHLDMLDDKTEGVRGKATYCLCKNGEAREPMRDFVAGVVVAFLRAYLEGDFECLRALREDPHHIAPVELRNVEFLM